mmetsp:Transcript_70883/g.169721  ORF Transcript_70883/g.169721 Transcript_70883/m.169721 type:complete len:123 (+) Transcript_70883:87-455(+)
MAVELCSEGSPTPRRSVTFGPQEVLSYIVSDDSATLCKVNRKSKSGDLHLTKSARQDMNAWREAQEYVGSEDFRALQEIFDHADVRRQCKSVCGFNLERPVTLSNSFARSQVLRRRNADTVK